MASTVFTYAPTGASGNAVVSVSANTTNTGTTDRSSTVTLTGGGGSTAVSLKQLYRPYVTQITWNVPASGGTAYFVPHTEYDICFSGMPSWITAKRDQTVYSNGDKISKGVADGVQFGFVFDANTGAERDASTVVMKHFYDGSDVPQGNEVHFNIVQSANTGENVQIPVNINFNTDGRYVFQVGIQLDSLGTDSETIYFKTGTTAWTGTLSAEVDGATPLAMTVKVNKNVFDRNDYSNNISLDYGTDSLYETGPTETAYIFNTTYQSGEEINIDIDVQLI